MSKRLVADVFWWCLLLGSCMVLALLAAGLAWSAWVVHHNG